MSELKNIMHFLPTFAWVFILLVYNRFGLSSVITVRACANSPLLQCSSFLTPFLFSHRDHAVKRFTDKFLFSPWRAGCKKERSWLSFVNQEYLHYFITNLVSSLAFGCIVFRGISRVFLITVPAYLSAKPIGCVLLWYYYLQFLLLKLRGKGGHLLLKCLLYFLGCTMSLCSLHSLIISL